MLSALFVDVRLSFGGMGGTKVDCWLEVVVADNLEVKVAAESNNLLCELETSLENFDELAPASNLLPPAGRVKEEFCITDKVTANVQTSGMDQQQR